MYVPAKMFLTKGVGNHSEKLASFEMALRNAGIAAYNLVLFQASIHRVVRLFHGPRA